MYLCNVNINLLILLIMFTFTKSEFEKSLPASGVVFNYLSEFPALMMSRTPAEFYNFRTFISKIESVSDLKSFERVYFSISTDQKLMFASFTRILLNCFSAFRICRCDVTDSDFTQLFLEYFGFYDTFLGRYTFYQTFVVLSLSYCFVHFAAENPSVFDVPPIQEDATFDEYGIPRFWLKYFPQLPDFYRN